jgi:histidine ammonia-lyase
MFCRMHAIHDSNVMTVTLNTPGDLNFDSVVRVIHGGERLALGAEAVAVMVAGHDRFDALIEAGVPCYGVTTGLGKLSGQTLDAEARRRLPRNILLARAAAVGEPFASPVARAMLMLKLGNLISGLDGTSVAMAEYLVDRINDRWTPWVPGEGHGMGADATANTHCFQTLIGEGYLMASDGSRVSATEGLALRGIEPYEPGMKEGLALLNGVAAAPALAIHIVRQMRALLDRATLVAAMSIDAMAAPRDALHRAVGDTSGEPGVHRVAQRLADHLRDTAVEVFNLQAPISYRIVPQIHGHLDDALGDLVVHIDRAARSFSDNPLMTDEAFLSVGSFHNQHLVSAMETVSVALAHVAGLSERRIHRLLDPRCTGLNPQLAPRPGLDAGMVVVHKAAIDHVARARMLAMPISLQTAETSGGQEDYMSMAVPAANRALELVGVVRTVLASELLTAGVALDQRGVTPGVDVAQAHRWLRARVAPLDVDRSPGPDIETLIGAFDELPVRPM